jgi:hypothetical protein
VSPPTGRTALAGKVAAALFAIVLLAAGPLLACPICFGDPASPMVHGAKMGVAFLLAVIVGMLVSIALIARSWARRARALDAAGQG